MLWWPVFLFPGSTSAPHRRLRSRKPPRIRLPLLPSSLPLPPSRRPSLLPSHLLLVGPQSPLDQVKEGASSIRMGSSEFGLSMAAESWIHGSFREGPGCQRSAPTGSSPNHGTLRHAGAEFGWSSWFASQEEEVSQSGSTRYRSLPEDVSRSRARTSWVTTEARAAFASATPTRRLFGNSRRWELL